LERVLLTSFQELTKGGGERCRKICKLGRVEDITREEFM